MKIHMTGLCLSALLLASPYALAADKPAEPAKTEVKADSKADTPKTEAAAELPTPPKEEVVAALGAAEKVLGEAKKAGVLWFVPFTAIKNIPNDDGVTNFIDVITFVFCNGFTGDVDIV